MNLYIRILAEVLYGEQGFRRTTGTMGLSHGSPYGTIYKILSF